MKNKEEIRTLINKAGVLTANNIYNALDAVSPSPEDRLVILNSLSINTAWTSTIPQLVQQFNFANDCLILARTVKWKIIIY